MKNHLKKTLINLAAGELVAVIVFWVSILLAQKAIINNSILPLL